MRESIRNLWLFQQQSADDFHRWLLLSVYIFYVYIARNEFAWALQVVRPLKTPALSFFPLPLSPVPPVFSPFLSRFLFTAFLLEHRRPTHSNLDLMSKLAPCIPKTRHGPLFTELCPPLHVDLVHSPLRQRPLLWPVIVIAFYIFSIHLFSLDQHKEWVCIRLCSCYMSIPGECNVLAFIPEQKAIEQTALVVVVHHHLLLSFLPCL